MDDFLEDKPKRNREGKSVFRAHRRLFLLVFAIAVLWQSISFIQLQLGQYFTRLDQDFKVILTVKGTPSNAVLTQIGESLSAKEDIASVRLFSPEDALEALKKANPQLAQSVLLMGKNKMPAYFELRLGYKAVNNINLFVGNLSAEYKDLSAKYVPQHAQMIFYTGLCLKILNITIAVALLLFLLFMFLVEAYPSVKNTHLLSGAFSGVCAAIASAILLAALVYPTGFLMPALQHFTSIERQLVLVVFCGLLGWTLTKWQKF